MPLLRITFTELLATTGVFLAVLFMLFLFRGILGVNVTESSVTGDGVAMRDTEKRPCTVGVEGELPLTEDGDFFAGVAALGEEDLDFGEFFPGDAALGEEDFAFGDFFPGEEA